MHAHAVRLHNGRRAIAVDNEAGQEVALTVNQTESVVIGIVGNADSLPHGERTLQAAAPEGTVDSNVTERQHTHCYRAYLIVPYGNELLLRGHHSHDVAFLNPLVDTRQGTGEYPGMEAQQTFFLTPLKINRLVQLN